MEQAPFAWQGLIATNPAVLRGKPVVKGTRLAVEFLLNLLAAGWTTEQILANYPHLTNQSLRAVFAYAADLAHSTWHDTSRIEVDRDEAAISRRKRLIEQSGVIARGNPNAPPPKAPYGRSGMVKPSKRSRRKKP